MENKVINCNIGTCTHNDVQKCRCKLETINISPIGKVEVESKEQSMCESYNCYK